jgi:hypothetical protein
MVETVLHVPGTCKVCMSYNLYDVIVAVIIVISVKSSAHKQILM